MRSRTRCPLADAHCAAVEQAHDAVCPLHTVACHHWQRVRLGELSAAE